MAELPPQNMNAEQAVIGSMLLDNGVVDDVAAIVRPECFYAEAHQAIVGKIFSMRAGGSDGIDTATLAEELDRAGQLARIGGPRYLLEVLESVVHAAHAKHYAGIVRTKHRQRSAVYGLTDALQKLRRPTDDESITEALADAEQAIHRALEDGQTDEPRSIGDMLPESLAALSSGRGMHQSVSSGFESFDNFAGGFSLGGMGIVAARPSLGKTAWLLSCGYRGAEAGVPVLFVSYEQTQSELTSRVLSIVSGVPLSKLLRGGLNQADAGRVVECGNYLAHLPLYFDDACRDEATLAATIRLQVRRRGVKIVIIDYLQLVTPSDRKAIREQQVASISRTLKLVAMQTGVAVIVASQLNRQVEQRDNKRPRLSDLRESGAIEQDADVVMFLHRPGKDDLSVPDDHAELVIAKNRNGPTGIVPLAWHGECARYSDPVREFA